MTRIRLGIGLAALLAAVLAGQARPAAPAASCPSPPAGWTTTGVDARPGTTTVQFYCDYYQGPKHVALEVSYLLPSDPGNGLYGCGIGEQAWTTSGHLIRAVSKTTWAATLIDDYDVQMAAGDVPGFTAAASSALATVEGSAKPCPAAAKPATTTTTTVTQPAATPAATAAWAAPVDPEVSLASVSNGCGGGVASEEGRYGDTSTFLDSNNPLGKRYEVNFRLACNLHDAGYSGSKVADPINGGVIDYYNWSQKMVDDKFLADMIKLCKKVIPASAATALAECEAHGGKTSFGAGTRYSFVRSQGFRFYRDRPNLTSAWNGNGSRFVIDQHLRSVTMRWTNGEFRGTIVSRDQDSMIVGTDHVISGGKVFTNPVVIKVDPDAPNALQVEVTSDGRYVTLRRL